MTFSANDALDLALRTRGRSRRHIGIAIGVVATVLLLLAATVVYWHLQIACEVRFTEARLVGQRCHIRIESSSRDGAYFYTVQKKRETGNEERGAWLVGSSTGFNGGSKHWRFQWEGSANIRIPLADVSTLVWYVQEGDHFKLRAGDELPILSCRVRGGSEDVDIDYFLRVNNRE